MFDFLQDISNHPRFTDHFFTDWRLTREDPRGLGAGARFRIKAPLNRFAWGDLTFTELEPPYRLVATGRMGKANRIRMIAVYELAPAASGTTRVSLTFETIPPLLTDRLREALGARWWMKRQLSRALRRLRSIMESAEPPPVRLPRGMRTARNPALLLASALIAAFSLSACGSADNIETSGTYAGEGGAAAPYLTVGPLVYQVQISRQLNPFDEEDSEYLAGLSPAQARLAPGEEWFAVFIQVHNDTSHPQRSATVLALSDTQGYRYTPVIPVGANPYIYSGGDGPCRRPDTGAQLDRGLRPDTGRAAALQDQGLLAQQPPDHDQDHRSDEPVTDRLGGARRLTRRAAARRPLRRVATGACRRSRPRRRRAAWRRASTRAPSFRRPRT